MKLEVGKTYRIFCGDEVTIIKYNNCYFGMVDICPHQYDENGKCLRGMWSDISDIMFEIPKPWWRFW